MCVCVCVCAHRYRCYMCYLLRGQPLHHFEVPTATRKVERLPPVAVLQAHVAPLTAANEPFNQLQVALKETYKQGLTRYVYMYI